MPVTLSEIESKRRWGAYKEGESVAVMAEEAGVSYNTYRQWMYKEKLAVPNKSYMQGEDIPYFVREFLSLLVNTSDKVKLIRGSALKEKEIGKVMEEFRKGGEIDR